MSPITRRLTINLMMLALSAGSLFFALCLRFDFHTEEFFNFRDYLFPLSLLLCARQITRIYWDLNAIAWRYVASPDLQRIFKGYLASSLIFAALIYAFSFAGFPRSVLAIEFFIAFMMDSGLKFAARMFYEWQHDRAQESGVGVTNDVLVIGAGYSGHLLVKTLLSQQRAKSKPVACLDDIDRLQGASVHGIPVVGRVYDLEDILSKSPNIKAVIVAIPSLTNSKYRAIEQICSAKSVLVKKVQSFEDIACLDSQSEDSQLSIESLLAKPVSFKHETEIAQKVADQIIMVTGAGGSIGSEICRQLLALGAKKVIFYDNSEYNLYRLDREMSERFGEQRCRSVIGNVIDENRVAEIIREEKPGIIFHAAAFKHVPLMEFNAKEAFKNNVIGTRNVLFTAAQLGVGRFVFISTDKAVDPSNVMGATKRLGELLVQEFARVSSGSTQVAAVRFGNVINSAGSVIPLFKEQISRGGPITVTHPEVERFFMSIPEAVKLVLTAGILGNKGETFVLDMGKKLKVIEVAKRMLSLYGRRDIEIAFTGLRPGEKITEELIGMDEVLLPTTFSGITQLSPASTSVNIHWNSIIAGLQENMDKKSDKQFVLDLLNAVSAPESANNKGATPLSASITTEIVSDAPVERDTFPASAGQASQAAQKRF